MNDVAMVKDIRSTLTTDLSEPAVNYAINRLLAQPANSITSPLYWCRTVAQRWEDEQKNWKGCGACERGWIWRDDLPNTVAPCHCHPNHTKLAAR